MSEKSDPDTSQIDYPNETAPGARTPALENKLITPAVPLALAFAFAGAWVFGLFRGYHVRLPLAMELLKSGFLISITSGITWILVERRDPTPEFTARDGEILDARDLELSPDIKESRFGLLKEWRARRKRKKLGKGFVEWHLVNGGVWSWTKYVKPKKKGGGIPQLKHDGETYLFPREAAVPSSESGMFVFVHKEGEADPINLEEPSQYAIPTDRLQEYLNLMVSRGAPSWLEGMGFSMPENPARLALYGFLAFIAIQAFLNGDLPGL